MNAKDLIKSTKGKFFTVVFIKRTNGQLRVMNCRTGVTKYLKGGSKGFNDSDHNLVTVFDTVAKAYRSIPLDAIVEIRFGGKIYKDFN